MANLNPDIRTITVGIKTLTQKTVYPLSAADQKKFLTKIFDTISTITSGKMENMEGDEFASFAVDAIFSNIELILPPLSDDDNPLTLEEMTNNQLLDLAMVIYEVNYETFLKNLKGLWSKLQEQTVGITAKAENPLSLSKRS